MLEKQESDRTLSEQVKVHRRFDRLARLYGEPQVSALQRSQVMIIGLGGVGGFAAESLARSAVGRITLVDFDEVCITNTNRQIQALTKEVGNKKALVLKERLEKINPLAEILARTQFFNAASEDEILAPPYPDFVVDAIDNLSAKARLLAACKQRGVRVITSGGAAGRTNPLGLKLMDLAKTHEDQMLEALRKILRQDYQFPRTGDFNIPCVFSTEKIKIPQELSYDKGQGFTCVCPHKNNGVNTCEKKNVIHGSASFVTGSFGLALAGYVVETLIKEKDFSN